MQTPPTEQTEFVVSQALKPKQISFNFGTKIKMGYNATPQVTPKLLITAILLATSSPKSPEIHIKFCKLLQVLQTITNSAIIVTAHHC